MNKSHIFFISLFLFTVHTQIHAQIAQLNPKIVTANQYEAKALEAYNKKEYNKALEYYSIVLNDYPKRTDLYWNTAESARQTRHYNLAYKYFETLSQTDSAKNYPQLTYKRALVKKSLGDYDGAVALLKTVTSSSQLSGVGSASEYLKEVQAEIDACEWAKPITQLEPNYDLVHIDENINTVYTDMAPVQYGNTLYYTSAYFENATAKPVTRVYMSDTKSKGTQLPINSTLKDEFTAHFALNTEGSRVYYTTSKVLEDGTIRSEILTRTKSADGSWAEPVRLSDAINLAGYTNSQPSVGLDNAAGIDILYFASDRPGGKGGMDIWYAEIDARGNVGTPKNLSDVNTPKDDVTPYYFNQAQILFFSSEGYKSMGGFDVYYVNKTQNNVWSTPINAGFPLNSSYDEIYYTIGNETARSYFVSNRKGGQCASPDKDCVCNDIYYYDIKLKLKAETFLATTGEALKGCQVELLDVETGKSIKIDLNKEGNEFNFPLDLNKKYRLIGSKENHIPDTIDFDTKGLWQSATIYKKLQLRPNLKLNILVFDDIDRLPLNGARVDMREVGTDRLILSENLVGNTLTTSKIEFGKSYWIYGFKDTYEPDSSLLVIDAYGTSDRYEYSDSLYLKPFQGLPLTLYFDDDHPNPRNRDTKTSLTYGQTYQAYIAKEGEYLKAYYGNNKNISFNTANEISDFFRDSIKFNYNKMMKFMGLMKTYLKNGKTFEIVIEGFASPLAAADYNRNLTSRRISSLINQIGEFDNGVLRPYMNDKKLLIRVLPFGESKARPGVSDDFNDQRNSIYNVKAMRERKVEIREINQLSEEEKKNLSFGNSLEEGGYWDFSNKISFLGRNLPSESSADGISIGVKGIPNPDDMPASYSKVVKKGVRTAAKQRHEFVLVDSYTGKVIEKNAQVEILEADNNKSVGTARHKGDKFNYDLKGDNKYLVKANAKGYSVGVIIYDGNTEGVEVVRDTMFLTPFSGLPLPLYFNNDKPAPKNKREIPSVPYDKSYKDYISQKKDFVRQFNNILQKEGSVPMVENQMEAFFDKNVKTGFEKLEGYISILKSYLEQGKRIEIVLEGYASPLANAAYNEDLTARRINSVVNYFSSSKGGSLGKYIKSGQLELSVRPLGESQADKNVSDDVNDPKRSIYSLEASKERRVEIKDILIKTN